ncbi:hypothetical protein QTN25_010728 [Entamoeba marina]
MLSISDIQNYSTPLFNNSFPFVNTSQIDFPLSDQSISKLLEIKEKCDQILNRNTFITSILTIQRAIRKSRRNTLHSTISMLLVAHQTYLVKLKTLLTKLRSFQTPTLALSNYIQSVENVFTMESMVCHPLQHLELLGYAIVSLLQVDPQFAEEINYVVEKDRLIFWNIINKLLVLSETSNVDLHAKCKNVIENKSQKIIQHTTNNHNSNELTEYASKIQSSYKKALNICDVYKKYGIHASEGGKFMQSGKLFVDIPFSSTTLTLKLHYCVLDGVFLLTRKTPQKHQILFKLPMSSTFSLRSLTENGFTIYTPTYSIIIKSNAPRKLFLLLRELNFLYDPPAVFGVPLNKLLEREGSKIPKVIEMLGNVLTTEPCISTEGIYRVSGGVHKVGVLVHLLNLMPYESLDLTTFNVCDIASVFKKYFKDLPEPLIPNELCIESNHDIKYEISKIDTNRLNLLKYLCGILYKTSLMDDTNKMSAKI